MPGHNITLADLYYAQPDYLNAQSYYDSAVAIINIDYPNYQIIYTKSVSLTKLVKYINTVHFEDSVLNLANMNKEELTALIDDLIKKEIQIEEENRQKQLETDTGNI